MNALVVYYSLTGNTAFAADRIARELGAGLLRLAPVKTYPDSGFRKFFWGGKSAVMAETPALQPFELAPGAFDLVVIGFPVWAGNVAPPIRTFLRDSLPKAERYAAFACQSGAGAERAFQKLKACLGHELAQTLVLIDPKDRPDAEAERRIADFCARLRE